MHNQPSTTAEPPVQWYHPGEIIIVARVRRGATNGDTLRRGMHAALRRHQARHVRPEVETLRSFVFDAPDEPTSLVFYVQKLAQSDDARSVKDAIEDLHGGLGNLRTADVEVIGAMPHWHMLAHEFCGGGSPGSLPAPVHADRVPGKPARRVYRPRNASLDLAARVEDAEPIRVAVLDTRWDPTAVRRSAEQFRDEANNHQLVETIEWLERDSARNARLDDEWREVAQHHTEFVPPPRFGEPAPYPMPDHGLFVSGLIHGVAPRARLSYEPVLDEKGIGDISLLLAGLQQVLANKRPETPQIVNLSLGFLPHPARLPAAWFGLRRDHDPRFLYAPELFDPARDQRWVNSHRRDVDRTVDLLEVGLRELGRYLSLNNCLVVSAAGNDSLEASEAGRVRMQPRLPARFETVMGVAATTADPRIPAPYSNIGDERELGDHVSTFGGNVTHELLPEDGVIGNYAGQFPSGAANTTGWAAWSGTSFATAIVTGIAANLWADARRASPNIHAREVLAELHERALESGPYLPELRTPSIEVEGRWE
jgi:hypothetical protein